jgi:hypothetical protein
MNYHESSRMHMHLTLAWEQTYEGMLDLTNASLLAFQKKNRTERYQMNYDEMLLTEKYCVWTLELVCSHKIQVLFGTNLKHVT